MENSILLIDGHSILNRAFYGLPPLKNAKGVYTNAVYGFLTIMFKVIDEVEPDHIAVAFDLSEPTFRHRKYAEYKGTRKPMPEELKSQVPLIKDVLRAMDIEIVEMSGFEADDIIGTTARTAEEEGMTAVILSGDRDLLQLVTDKTVLKLPKTSKGTTTVETFTPQRVKEVYSIEPRQIIDLKAMMGDSSDNIPGLPGVGEKTATNLVSMYGSLENAHEHLDEIKPKRAMESMRDNYKLAVLSKDLATIKLDVPMEKDPKYFKLNNFYTAEAYSLYKELGFKNLFSRFEESEKTTDSIPETKIVSEFGKAEEIFKDAAVFERASFYIDVCGDNICGAAIAFDEKIYYIEAGGFITEAYLIDSVKRLIDSLKTVTTYRFKEQQNILRSGYTPKMFDCIIAAYLLDPLRSEYSYDYLADKYASLVLPSAEEVVGSKITAKTVLTDEQRIKTAAFTAYSAYRARAGIAGKLAEEKMDKLFEEIEMPFAYTLSDMETAGIKINTDELSEYSDMLSGQIEITEKKIFEQAGEEFNIQSPKQLGVILFEKLKLPGGKKTKTGYSTAADALEKLAEEAPIVNDILYYRQLTKLKSTYADSLGDYAGTDGRIHSHFLQTVTATGRISSADPNLQNIPVRMELGRQIRKVFVPKEGCVFVDADYSQIELRILAHMSDDKKLIEAYNQESDIHRITASLVFGVPFDEVTPLQRRNAKAVNFGIVYGISSFGLSQDLSISRKEAGKYIEQYFKTYPGIKNYLDNTVAGAKKIGYTTTIYGRRRPIPELRSSNFMQRSFGERVAMNSPIQGTAADIIKIAMNNVNRRLKEEGLKTRLILQVHDELLLEAPLDEAERAGIILRGEMENAAKLRVRLEVDLNTGRNWDEAH
ncbi:MAG: DNA polymerase I [Lachnospiraceae bacterium]|nr:DNA polymerase I [Lachnospiraceae bacterium]MDY6220897.1 DNA polymerase I [Candidatus Alectryocaccobium sp.]